MEIAGSRECQVSLKGSLISFLSFFFLLYRSLCLSMCSAVIKSLKVENHKIVRRNQKSFFICQFHYGKRLFWSHTQTVKNDLYILTGWFSVLECIQLLLPLAWQFSEHFSFLNSINTKNSLLSLHMIFAQHICSLISLFENTTYSRYCDFMHFLGFLFPILEETGVGILLGIALNPKTSVLSSHVFYNSSTPSSNPSNTWWVFRQHMFLCEINTQFPVLTWNYSLEIKTKTLAEGIFPKVY